MKQSFVIILLLALMSCNNSKNEAPAFSLVNITSEQLPAYNIVSSNTGDMGQSYYTLEWQSPLTEQDSLRLKNLLSDFYEGADNTYFKCYAQGDSSVCFHINNKGLIITKQRTAMFKPIIDLIFNDVEVAIPNNLAPSYYESIYDSIGPATKFNNNWEYSIGFVESFLSESDVRKLYLWDKIINEGYEFMRYNNVTVCIRVDTIGGNPMTIIRYTGHYYGLNSDITSND